MFSFDDIKGLKNNYRKIEAGTRTGSLVLLFFTLWMGALHVTFDYNGKRKLSKTIIEGRGL